MKFLGSLRRAQFFLSHPMKTVNILFGKYPSDIEIKSILERLSDSPCIIEAGTSIGQHTEVFAKRFPNGQIIGFEPIFELFEECKKRTQNYRNVNVFNLALGNKGQNEITLYWDDETKHDSASSLQPHENMSSYYPNLTFQTKRVVKSKTLDDVVVENRLKKIDLLWLDLQGAELSVLRNGGMYALSLCKYVHIEVAKSQMYRSQPLLSEVSQFFCSNDFQEVERALGWQYGNILYRKLSLS